MRKEFDIKEVKSFYDSVGWQITENGVYQNARYEDLRSVSREYIHKCHMRINRHISHQGKYLLDAGSGPIQYPEYLTYSQGYTYRVCLDLSHVALMDGRNRIGSYGLFVVADFANMPFADAQFDDVVSLHTFHHLPLEGRKKAYAEVFRMLSPESNAVIVNGWNHSPLMDHMRLLMKICEHLFIPKDKSEIPVHSMSASSKSVAKIKTPFRPQGTFVEKFDAETFKKEILPQFNSEILVWRSVSVQFLRTVIHKGWGGKMFLRILYRLEEWFPRYFGEKGQYPLIIIKKREG